MSHQKISTIVLIIVISSLLMLGFTLWALPTGHIGFFIIPFAIWVFIMLVSLVRHIKVLRPFVTFFGIFLIGVPFTFLLAKNPYYGTQDPVILTISLTIWALVSGLFTRSARGIYWALHVAAWIFGVGIAIVNGRIVLVLLLSGCCYQ